MGLGVTATTPLFLPLFVLSVILPCSTVLLPRFLATSLSIPPSSPDL